MFKKADIILGIVLLALGLGVLGFLRVTETVGSAVVVTVDGTTLGSYSLSEDATVDIPSINGHNTMEIKGGQVRMTDADCPNKDCMNFGSIGSAGQLILCLPNRVTLRITGEGGPDAVTY